jgi:hypothetical protein
MLEHNPFPPKAEETTGNISTIETRVETYLDTLCAKLSETLTEEQRQAYRAEIREHLETMIEAHEELGALPEEAVERALQQFGDTRRIAGAWEQVAEPYRSVSLREALRAPGCWFGGAMFVWIAAFLIMTRIWNRFLPSETEWALMLWLIGLPVLAGYGAGLTTRGRPVLGTLLVLPPLHLALALCYWLQPYRPDGLLPSVLLQLTSWSLFGASAAGITHKIRRWLGRLQKTTLT